MRRKLKNIFFICLAVIIFSFIEPGMIKPAKVSKIMEFKEQVYRNDKRSEKQKPSELQFDKDGRLTQSLLYNFKGDTNGLFRIIYDKKLKPVQLRYYQGKGKWASKNIRSRGDTIETKTEINGEVYTDFYVFNKRNDVIEYGNNKLPYARPSYKAVYNKDRLLLINFLSADDRPFLVKYVYRKEGINRNIREKYEYALEPRMDDGTKEDNSPKETVIYNDKKEILQRIVINSSDTSFYTYKYQYYK